MPFVFSRLFYILLAVGLVPLSVSWQIPVLRTVVFTFDGLLVLLAIADFFISRRLPEGVSIHREFERRFAIGDSAEVRVVVANGSQKSLHLIVKDEYPSAMRLDDD